MADIEFDEKSSGSVTVTFKARDGAAVPPTAITWTLTTSDGATVINSREQIAVPSPAASIEILLSGDDLALLSTEQGNRAVVRRLTIEAVYDSDLGTDIPLRDDKLFTVRNLKYISS